MTPRTRTFLDDVTEAITWYRSTGGVTPNAATGTGAIRILEAQFRDRLGVAACLAVNSGTAALTVAMQCCNVGPGTTILIPDPDWPASQTVAHALGARTITYT